MTDTVILISKDRIAEGSFADVFVHASSGRAIKLFRSFKNGPKGGAIAELCSSEVAAYERAQSSTDLRTHIPKFFGQVIVTDVVGADGASHAHRYNCTAAYAMEFLSGEGRKFDEIPRRFQPAIEALAERFEEAGIDHVCDGDIFDWEIPDSMKFIDIATYDVIANNPRPFMEPSDTAENNG